MAVKLGIGGVVNLLDVAAQLGQITHRAEPNVRQVDAHPLIKA